LKQGLSIPAENKEYEINASDVVFTAWRVCIVRTTPSQDVCLSKGEIYNYLERPTLVTSLFDAES